MKRVALFFCLLLPTLACGGLTASDPTPAPVPANGAATGEEAPAPDTSPADDGGPIIPTPPAATTSGGGGIITYTFDNALFRIAATSGAAPENVSRALDSRAPAGQDEFLNISPDGAWLLLSSDRFDEACAGWPCLALLPADLSTVETIHAGGDVLHPEGFGAVASGGDLVVFPMSGGPHDLDLWAVTRNGGGWTGPTLLTETSPYAFHTHPALAADSRRLVFQCGSDPYGQEGTAMCLVDVDGSNFQVALTPEQGPGGTAQNALHGPDFAPDGSLVFEADWYGEQVWRLPAGSAMPVLVGTSFNNDNSPCVLADGRIVSLWLDREGGNGDHELKLMSADGGAYDLLLADTDIYDIGLGCGG